MNLQGSAHVGENVKGGQAHGISNVPQREPRISPTNLQLGQNVSSHGYFYQENP